MGKTKILIADNNQDIILLIKKRFEYDRYTFIEAYDGEEALKKIKKEKPDIILLDLKLPGKSGMEVLQELKDDFELKDIPVIVLTVVSEVYEKIKALEFGASDFLVKPPEPSELKARVNAQLELLKAARRFKKYSLYLENIVSRKMREIKEYTNRLEEMVEQKVGVIKRQNEELLISLNSAKKVQKSLLPDELLTIGGVEFESIFFPCDAIGGDFYDIFRIDEDNIGLYIADVSGHGLPSAMVTIFLKQEVFYHAKRIKRNGKYFVLSPKEVLDRLNQSFIENNIGEGRYFVTMIYCTYSLSKRNLKLSIAGHHALPVWKKESGDSEIIKLNGFPIGWFKKIGEYSETSLTLSRGDTVLFYTDGIFEIYRGKDKNATLYEMINSVVDLFTKEDLKDNLIRLVNGYIEKNKKLHDDIILLSMKLKE